MIAQYETKAQKGRAHVTAHRYGDLQNLPHWHTEYELVFADQGAAQVLVGTTTYALTPETCLLIPGGVVHYIKAEQGSVLSVIKIDPELMGAAFGNKRPVAVQHRCPDSAAAEFERIAAELQGGEEYCELISDSHAVCLLAQTLRGAQMQRVSHEHAGEDEKHKLLLNLIAEKYAEITFAEAAAFMCFSQPYFSKYFRRMSGMHFTDYLNIVRVNEAVRMLQEKRCSVTEIACRTGFGTIRSFNRVFKAVTGYTPRTLPSDYLFFGSRSDSPSAGVDPTVNAVILV